MIVPGPVHISDWAGQPDIRIFCDQSWTTPAWTDSVVVVEDHDGEGGVYRSTDNRLYTFTKSRVTCEACKKYTGI